ncbi:MAG: hypothetical protein E7428_02685 [Ruminococcaceae bacterium]|nr:hypothetical protein [Oscillospiraceae bacterium]
MSPLCLPCHQTIFTAELNIFPGFSPYLVTDRSTTLSNLANQCEDYTLVETLTPVGENKVVDSYYPFHLDAIALDDLTLCLFYIEKD